MVLGAQLYTVRMYLQTEKDMDISLGMIAKMGYNTVQVSGIGSSINPQTVKSICDKYSLKIAVTHTDPNRVLNDTENVIQEHKLMGCSYIGIGSMPDKYRNPEWLKYFIEDYKEPARKIKEAGMLLMYHNHDFELMKIDGKYYMDYLIEGFEPDELGFTLDTYWLQAAGTDVCYWIDKLKDRIPCVHLKDMAMSKSGTVMAPVLEGNMNFQSILRSLENSNCKFILVEQDTCQESPFDCLRKSYHNLSALGYR